MEAGAAKHGPEKHSTGRARRRPGSAYAAVLASGTPPGPILTPAEKKQKLRERRRELVDALRVVLRDSGIPDMERAPVQTLLEHAIAVAKGRRRGNGESQAASPEQSKPRSGGGDQSGEAHVKWREALFESQALIVLEVGLETWEVLASSKAMCIFAPIPPMVGYLRQSLGILAHQDDWPVLNGFRDRLRGGGGAGEAIVPGDVVSVRFLRNFKDEHTDAMFFEYVRLCLEVGHVYRDGQGRAERVLFTCVPNAGVLKPRGRDAEFWDKWYKDVQGYCGVFQPDLLRSTSSLESVYQHLSHHEVHVHADQPQSTLASLVGGIGASVHATGSSVWFWLTKQLAHVMKLSLIVGRGEDKVTPRLQGSTSLCLLGIRTDWRTFLSVDLAGRASQAGIGTVDGRRGPGFAQFGVLLNEGIDVVGAVGVVHMVLPDGRKVVRAMHKSVLDMATMEHSDIFLTQRGCTTKNGTKDLVRFDFKLASISAQPPDAMRNRFEERLGTPDLVLFPVGFSAEPTAY